MNGFGFLHAHSNSLFLQSQIHYIIFPLSFSFKGEQCLVKNALGTISSLCSTNMTLCSQQAKDWESAALGSKQPMGKQDKGRRGPKASPKTHTLKPSLSLSALAGLL